MNSSIRKRLARGKRKNQHRLRDIEWEDQPRPMFSASNIQGQRTLNPLRHKDFHQEAVIPSAVSTLAHDAVL